MCLYETFFKAIDVLLSLGRVAAEKQNQYFFELWKWNQFISAYQQQTENET